MRTTLTLDDDLAAFLKEQAARTGLSFKEIVNRTLRNGIVELPLPEEPAPKTVPHHFGFKPGVDLDKLSQLVDELDTEHRLEDLSRT